MGVCDSEDNPGPSPCGWQTNPAITFSNGMAICIHCIDDYIEAFGEEEPEDSSCPARTLSPSGTHLVRTEAYLSTHDLILITPVRQHLKNMFGDSVR